MVKGLSKSKLLSYRQCPKKLYLEVNYPDRMEVSPELQKIFDTGHAVGQLAQTFYPDGMLIEHDFELNKAIDETNTYLSDKGVKSLFEATFNHKDVLIRSDLLHKTPAGLHVQEVKSATSVKEVNVEDCAIQMWVIEGTGYNVDEIELTYINNQFVLEEEGNYDGLFNHQSLLDDVRTIQPVIHKWVKGAKEVLTMGEEPEIEVGEQCNHPYDCPFTDYCDPDDTEYPVELLPRGTRMAIELRHEGIHDIRDIPDGRLNTETHERVRRVTIAGKYELDPDVKQVMREIGYPRYYIDFETIGFAIPRWLGTRPYQQIPFQWSCHVEQAPGKIEHVEFLDLTGEDPSRAFIKKLIEALGEKGPVLVYNAGFENSQLKALAERYPEFEAAIMNIIDRVFDLLPIARKYYYHPDMRGSWSIKAVLPTIAPELDYSGLEEVHHGMEAQDAYIESIQSEISKERKDEIQLNLVEYCKLDTLAMVKIARFFEN